MNPDELDPVPDASPAAEAAPSGRDIDSFTEAPAGGEEVDGLGLMVGAYVAVWVLLLLFVLTLLARHRRQRRELVELRARLDALDAALVARDGARDA